MIEVCYCIDKNTEICGFVSLFTLLLHTREKISVVVCYDQSEQLPGSDWASRLNEFGFDFELRHQCIENSVFRKCRSAFGSHAPYLLLSSPRHSFYKKLLYVDADTIFSDDIVGLYGADLVGKEIGMFKSGRCGERGPYEKKILAKYGKTDEDPYFGSTVCLVDTQLFRHSMRFEKFKQVAFADPFHLMLWDQSVINCSYARNEIHDLGLEYTRWIQEAPRAGITPKFTPGMIHFCGTPKPWDLFGEHFHPYYNEWRKIAIKAGFYLPNIRNYFSYSAIRRAIKSRRQYAVWFNKKHI